MNSTDIEAALTYYENILAEADEFLTEHGVDCSVDLLEILAEQKRHAQTAINALRRYEATDCGCKARQSFDTEEEAIEAWNRRADNGTD